MSLASVCRWPSCKKDRLLCEIYCGEHLSYEPLHTSTDPKPDLFHSTIESVPKERRDDIVFIDPTPQPKKQSWTDYIKDTPHPLPKGFDISKVETGVASGNPIEMEPKKQEDTGELKTPNRIIGDYTYLLGYDRPDLYEKYAPTAEKWIEQLITDHANRAEKAAYQRAWMLLTDADYTETQALDLLLKMSGNAGLIFSEEERKLLYDQEAEKQRRAMKAGDA